MGLGGGRRHRNGSPREAQMILLGLGANLPSLAYGPPRATLQGALSRLPDYGVTVLARSSWYESPAVPPSAQPRFVNAVASLATELAPEALLDGLHALEARLGRRRRRRWEARVADLDLLGYHDLVRGPGPDSPLELPHPRMSERAFVLRPLVELAADWRHPVSGLTAAALLAALPEAERAAVSRLADD
jgi:2-amino-4-hydroxy-6-hydroxymethyldihydropteridine diphosphokinase